MPLPSSTPPPICWFIRSSIHILVYAGGAGATAYSISFLFDLEAVRLGSRKLQQYKTQLDDYYSDDRSRQICPNHSCRPLIKRQRGEVKVAFDCTEPIMVYIYGTEVTPAGVEVK